LSKKLPKPLPRRTARPIAISDALRAYLVQEGIGVAAFFVNAVDTHKAGIDLTITGNTEVGDGELTTYFAVKHGKTEIQTVNVLLALGVATVRRSSCRIANGASSKTARRAWRSR
jgi:hypothetical protein